MKQPKRCKGCVHFLNAGHPQGSALYTSKYNCWCSQFGTVAYKATSVCISQNSKKIK